MRAKPCLSTSCNLSSSDRPSLRSVFCGLTALAAACVAAVAQQTWNPLDTDADGLPDAWENHFWQSLTQGAAGDPDGDGVDNLTEFQAGLSPILADTDGDGRNDSIGVPGFLNSERWNGVTEPWPKVFSSPAFLSGLPLKGFVGQTESPQNTGEYYLMRWRGTLVAPVAGDYRFYIASDDQSQLWLGDAGGSKFTRKKIASAHSWSGYRAWTATPFQDSGLIRLQAGESYYIEVMMRQGVSADHLSVGWVRPGQTAVEIIPGKLADGTVVLRGYEPDPLDADDDGLLDSWELGVGLNIGDNGSINSADGGYSDWDQDGLSNYEEWQTQGNPFSKGGNMGVFRRDIWTGISTSAVTALTSHANFAKPAQIAMMMNGGLKLGSYADNYGQRLRGIIVPPVTGNYRFWVAADDSAELWLSTNASRLNKKKIAFLNSWTSVDSFDATPSQKSASIPLVAGQPYYYEVLQKESVSADHVSVAWNVESPNWAREPGATATQSTDYSASYPASKAIDGSTSGSTFAQTNSQPNNWWEVDLGQPRAVSRIVLFNRSIAQERLSNFRISVRNSQGVEVVGQNFFVGTGSVGNSMTWDLPVAVTASKIRISLLGLNNAGNGCLQLAEVQVYDWKNLSVRQIVAADYLRSEQDEPLDADGDSLPDAWETKFGLSASDGGSTKVAFGEYGDPDGDSVPNLYEYLNGTSPTVPNGEPGKMQRDIWTNLAGNTPFELVTSPEFLEPANTRDTITSWPGGSGDDYGQRLRGTVTAPVTGWYTFWIAGNDGCELSLSSNDRKFLKQRIAEVGPGHQVFSPYFTFGGEYDKYAWQRSKPIYLVANTAYFLEVLHKENSAADWVTPAWQPPGGSREAIPFTALRSFSYDIDDVDDDDLPDSWESQHGLDPADNGRLRRGIEGALGDADGDQLNNREEFLLGTNPLDSDSDHDGTSDYVETRSLGSDPNRADSGTGAILTDLKGSEGTSLTGNWLAGPNDTLLSLDRRGSAAWPFTITTPGAKLIEVLAIPQGNTWAGSALTVGIDIVRLSDSKRWSLGTFPLRDDEGQSTRVLALLPWLQAGNYRAEIAIRNVSESRNVRIDRVRIIDPGGTDANGNGIVDWLETRLETENGLLTTTGASLVSPACLEGVCRNTGNSWLDLGNSTQALEAGPDNRWFANIALPVNGSPYALTAKFEDGLLEQPHTVTWTPTNVLQQATLTLRDGDSLRLTGFPGASADQGAVAISSSGQSVISTTANVPVVRKFELENWALASRGSSATQSSTYQGASASRAIDGNTSGYLSSGSVTHTNNGYLSWWEVDFGQDREVGRIVLWNRLDPGTRDRLSNFTIDVLDGTGVKLAYKNFYSTVVDEKFAWSVPRPVQARKVRITIHGYNFQGNGYLSLAEVQVFPRTTNAVLDATHTANNGTVTSGSTTVQIVSADFADPLEVRSERWRNWLPAVPASLPLEWDSRLKIAYDSQNGSSYNLRVAAYSNKLLHLLARSEMAGSVVAKGTVDPFLIGDPYDTGYVEVLETLPGGAIHGRISVVADRLPPGGYVQIEIWAGGAQFANGATVKNLGASAFDANGVAYVDVYYPSQAAISSFCASYRLRAADNTILSNY
jgi:hypothetical protein